jgi:hypothetical protein
LNNTICYNCDEKGHIASNCPLPQRNHPRGRPRDRSNSLDKRSPSSRSRDHPFGNRSATPAPSRHRTSSAETTSNLQLNPNNVLPSKRKLTMFQYWMMIVPLKASTMTLLSCPSCFEAVVSQKNRR